MDVSSETSSSSPENQTWLKHYISQSENVFLCEVDEDFINDRFNLTGLNEYVNGFQTLIPMLFDDPPDSDISDDASSSSDALPMIYGLIHARYILTSGGLHKMATKYKNNDFGCCPRVYCNQQNMLPIGISDIPTQYTVRLYCPRCNDIYHCDTQNESYLDGAYFGTGFPHMFFMTFPELRPKPPVASFEPRLFGFKLSPKAVPLQLEKAVTSRNNKKRVNGEKI